jgi:hypothetical protein
MGWTDASGSGSSGHDQINGVDNLCELLRILDGKRKDASTGPPAAIEPSQLKLQGMLLCFILALETHVEVDKNGSDDNDAKDGHACNDGILL